MKLFNDDCLKVLPTIPDKSIDLILTDPPYGTTACKWDSVIPFEPMWKELKRIIKDNSAIALFGSEPFSSYLRTSNIKWFKYDWIWHKNFSGGFSSAKKQPMKYHEIISIFYNKQSKYNPQFEEYAESVKKRFKEGERVNTDKQLKKSTNKIHKGFGSSKHNISFKKGKYPQSVQKIKGVPNCNNIRKHPTQKPVALLEYLIKTYTNENDTVLDFTMGSGSTGVACKNLNRDFIGIELDQEYFKIAKERIESTNPLLI
jgi:DNA modification methylase